MRKNKLVTVYLLINPVLKCYSIDDKKNSAKPDSNLNYDNFYTKIINEKIENLLKNFFKLQSQGHQRCHLQYPLTVITWLLFSRN